MSNGLPKGYEDWVEVSLIVGGLAHHHVLVTVEEFAGNGFGSVVRSLGTRMFVPPKPKPTLPDVKPGAVLRFTHKAYGTTVQAVKWRSGSDWHIQFGGAGGILCETYCSDTWLLANVNDDGFTIVLDAL